MLGKNWYKLHPNIQYRFNKLPTIDKPITYYGTMQEVVCSKAGWLFALLTRIIGNPLAPYQGKNIPMVVKLSTQANDSGVFWQRTYQFKHHKPYTVVSVKKEGNGKMMECVGAGFGMFLYVSAEDEALHFKSTRYFCKLFGCYVPLPHWLCPGQTHVIHKDLGSGQFRFTISMDHSLLGRTFYQTGIFNDEVNKDET